MNNKLRKSLENLNRASSRITRMNDGTQDHSGPGSIGPGGPTLSPGLPEQDDQGACCVKSEQKILRITSHDPLQYHWESFYGVPGLYTKICRNISREMCGAYFKDNQLPRIGDPEFADGYQVEQVVSVDFHAFKSCDQANCFAKPGGDPDTGI
jgi:hypothetical protein